MPASATQAQGQPFLDTIGGHFVNVVDWKGPKSYTAGTAESLDPAPFQCQEIMFAFGSVSISGTYEAICQPVQAGVTKWGVRYSTVSTGAEVASADLSGETFKIFGYGV